MAYWTEHTLMAAPQVSGLGTVNSTDADFEPLLCDVPKVTFNTEIQDLELLTGQIGAAPERLPGRRSGSLSFSIPLEGMKSGYDPTGGASDQPGGARGVVPYWLAMVGNILGGQIALSDTAAKFWQGLHLSNSEYTADGMASGTASSIVTDNNTASDKILGGELIIASATPTSTSPQIGFVKTKAVQTFTLFEAAANNPNSATADMYGTATAWLSATHGNQLPMTFRWCGQDTTFCYILQDAVCESFKLTWESGATPTIEFSFKFYDFSMDKTKGGLIVPDAFLRIPQIVGGVNGRAMLAAAVACGLENCTLEYKCEIKEIKCHSATQGITAVAYHRPRISASFSALHNSSDLVYDAAGSTGNTGQHVWQSYLERGVTVSLGVYVGSMVGRVFGFLIPAGRLIAVPAVEDRDGSVAYQLQLEAGSYTGDSTDTAETAATSPLDSIFRIAVG